MSSDAHYRSADPRSTFTTESCDAQHHCPVCSAPKREDAELKLGVCTRCGIASDAQTDGMHDVQPLKVVHHSKQGCPGILRHEVGDSTSGAPYRVAPGDELHLLLAWRAELRPVWPAMVAMLVCGVVWAAIPISFMTQGGIAALSAVVLALVLLVVAVPAMRATLARHLNRTQIELDQDTLRICERPLPERPPMEVSSPSITRIWVRPTGFSLQLERVAFTFSIFALDSSGRRFELCSRIEDAARVLWIATRLGEALGLDADESA